MIQVKRSDRRLALACSVLIVVTMQAVAHAGSSVAERFFTGSVNDTERVEYWNSILMQQLDVEAREELAGSTQALYELIFDTSLSDDESARQILLQLPLRGDGAVALRTVLLVVLGGELAEISESLRDCAVLRQLLATPEGCLINRCLFIGHALLNEQSRIQVDRYLYDQALKEYAQIIKTRPAEDELVKDMERLCINLFTVQVGGCSKESAAEIAEYLRTGQRKYVFGPAGLNLYLHVNDVLEFVCYGQGAPCEGGRQHLRRIIIDELASIVPPLERSLACRRIAGNLGLLHAREYSAAESGLGISPFADDRGAALDLVKRSIGRQQKIDKDTLLKAFKAALVTDTDFALTIYGSILFAATEADEADAAILLGHSQEVLGSIITLATYYRAKCGVLLEMSRSREERGESGLDLEEEEILRTTQQRITELVGEDRAFLRSLSELHGGYDRLPPGARVRER